MSQPEFPKQFVSIFNNRPLINQTIDRIKDYFKKDRRFFVVPEELRGVIKRFVGAENILIEPARRNTAPAICLCAMVLRKNFGDGIIHIMPADHIIKDKRRFIEYLKFGESMAQQNFLVTYGITPNRPETGYGYIKIGEKIKTEKGITGFYGQGFKEKPSFERAKQYLKEKKFLWNSGIFTYKISTVLDEIKKFVPDVYEGVLNYLRFKDKKYFEKISNISIDYGIMEKSHRICVVRSDFDWDDVGTWLALERYFQKDHNDNIFIGDVLGLETKGTIVYTNNMPVRVYGINGLVVAASPKGVLVCKKERTPDLKKLISCEFKKRQKRRL